MKGENAMVLNSTTAISYAKELTICAIENQLLQAKVDDTPEEVAKKVLAYFNTVADSLAGK